MMSNKVNANRKLNYYLVKQNNGTARITQVYSFRTTKKSKLDRVCRQLLTLACVITILVFFIFSVIVGLRKTNIYFYKPTIVSVIFSIILLGIFGLLYKKTKVITTFFILVVLLYLNFVLAQVVFFKKFYIINEIESKLDEMICYLYNLAKSSFDAYQIKINN